MKSADIKELKARKKALKHEMKEIQREIESSLDKVRHGVIERAKVRFWVDKYPLYMVGSALMTGFLIARKTGAGRSAGFLSRGIFTGLLTSEIKRMAAQRAIRFIFKRIEDAMDERRENAS